MSKPLVMCKAILHFDQCFNAACIKRTGNQMSQATERMRDLREINIFFSASKNNAMEFNPYVVSGFFKEKVESY